MTLDHHLAGMTIPQLIQSSRYDLVVATVVGVQDAGTTNAVPPKVTLRIDEVLRGDPALDRRPALWNPFPHDVDYGDVKSNPIYRKWASTPLRGPAVGSRFLLFGEVLGSPDGLRFHISPVGRFPFSTANRNLATKAIRGGGETDDL